MTRRSSYLLGSILICATACGLDRSEEPMLALTFAHEDHEQENCIDCHHNMVDETGMGHCFDCHRSSPDLAPQFEDQFHSLCRGCHETRETDGQTSGPVRQCVDCHRADLLF